MWYAFGMSYVTGVMLICRCGEEEPLAEIKQWLAERGQDESYWTLNEISDRAGGSKHPQFDAFAGGFNYFDEDEFAYFVMTRQWDRPEGVVLTLQPEETATRVFRPTGYGGTIELPVMNRPMRVVGEIV
jgi:hypothetical protein